MNVKPRKNKKSKEIKVPWWDQELEELKCNRNACLKYYLKGRSEQYFKADVGLRMSFKVMYKERKDEHAKILREKVSH